MLQSARSSESKSFLREILDALVLIKDNKVRNYFLNKMLEVLKKRKDENEIFTGEKALKSELLAYLKQFGYIRTANVWARNIPIDRKAINEFLAVLQQRLLDKDILGILELHLQDREINSPHIQFVGIKADEAEVIIAQTLVDFKYESSIESALGKKNFIPYYKISPQSTTQSLEDMLEYKKIQEEYKEKLKREEIDKFIEEFDKNLEELRKILREAKLFRKNLSERMTKLEEYRINLQNENHRLRRLRMRISRR